MQQRKKEDSFEAMAAILNYFVGKTVKSIELAKTRNRFGPGNGGGAQETAKGRWTEVTFTHRTRFVFDAHEPIGIGSLTDVRRSQETYRTTEPPNSYPKFPKT